MPANVLIEGADLTLARGTGIATYARNLTRAAQAAGYAADGLVNVSAPLDRRDPMLNEIAFFDIAPDTHPFLKNVRFAKSYLFGAPLGLRTQPLNRTGVVVGTRQSSLAGFQQIYAAVQLGDAANHHFGRYGGRARLRVASRPALFHATQPIPLVVTGCPNIYTIHDLVPLRLPFATLDDKKHFLKMVRHICRKADHIVTVSEHSRRDIMELCGVEGSRITNTYQAVSIPAATLGVSQDDSAQLVSNAFGLDSEDYFLFVGAIEPKKNLARLIDAYAASGSKRPLVIVGGLGWSYDRDVGKINDDRFSRYRLVDGALAPSRKVRMLSHLPVEQLFALVRGARALLFPSLYEGFGLPVVEAMQLGTPVLTSNVSSLPEVAGDAALLVDPLDTNAIARGIVALDADGDLRADLRQRGLKQAKLFSPENYTQRIANLYGRVLS